MDKAVEQYLPALLQVEVYVQQLRAGKATWRDYYVERLRLDQQGVSDPVWSALQQVKGKL